MRDVQSSALTRNSFQQLMWHWAQLHPYNGVAIVQLTGPAEPERFGVVAARAFERLGIRGIVVEVGVGGDDPASIDRRAIGRLATSELNRPFDPTCEWPVRWSLWPGEGHHHVIMTFDHWMADGYSMDWLLASVLAEYVGGSQPDPAAPQPLPISRLALATEWLARGPRLVREHVRMRRCHRPAHGDERDLSTIAHFPTLPGDLLVRLQEAARRHRCTINDLLMTALGEAVVANTPNYLRSPRRGDFAIAAVVDLRPLRATRLDVPGMHLSYFNVFCSFEEAEFDRMLVTLRDQAAAAKLGRRYLQGIPELAAAAWMWPRLPAGKRIAYFAHRKPVVGGVSNVRVPDRWIADALRHRLVSWRHAAPTGPMTPLVVQATSALGRLEMEISSRASGYSRDQVAGITASFCERVASL